MNQIEIIETEAALASLVERLCREPLLAVDLEADSLHHYTEKVCLIQVATPGEAVLIDPLAVRDLSPLAPIFADPAIRKVMHGADYDIRSLHRDFAIQVHNLFDTMIACQFLGEKELGLAAVLRKRFAAELDKRYQKADWSKRPLSPGMIAYAVEDTSLLIRLYGELRTELEERGRLVWVEEESQLLTGVRMQVREEGPLFLRFKGAAAMETRTLAVLEQLLRFRDHLARQSDRPPYKVLPNEALRGIAERKPRCLEELSGIAGFTPKLLDRYGRGVLQAVAVGCSLEEGRLPRYPRNPRPRRERDQEERLRELKEWRMRKSEEMSMDAGIMANNALLELLAERAPATLEELHSLACLKNWQLQALGGGLLQVLGSPPTSTTAG